MVICNHCGQDTSPTLKYCEFCGEAVDLDFERVGGSLADVTEAEKLVLIERRCRGYLFLATFILICVIALRIVLLQPVDVVHVPAHFVSDEKAAVVEPPEDLPVEIPPIEVPE